MANAAARKAAKLLALYEGPYEVKKRIARNTYILRNTETERERGQFLAADLKLYRADHHTGVGVTRQGGDNCSSAAPTQASGKYGKLKNTSFS